MYLEITVSPFKEKAKFIEAPVVFQADVDTKLPKPEAPATLLFVDEDGNPSPNQARQRELDIRAAPPAAETAQGGS